MVKRQKEKQYNSAREQRELSQQRSGGYSHGSTSQQRRLAFGTCCLSMNRIEDPVCNSKGFMFDASSLYTFIQDHGRDPITGESMTRQDVIVLLVDHGGEEGEGGGSRESSSAWYCPVLHKALTDHTKIVAIRQKTNRQTAYVYSYEAYHQLNVKAKHYMDLMTGEPFDNSRDGKCCNRGGKRWKRSMQTMGLHSMLIHHCLLTLLSPLIASSHSHLVSSLGIQPTTILSSNTASTLLPVISPHTS
jgi:hypothetical protein